MPEDGLDRDITLQELGLEDITSPELDDLSISVLGEYEQDYSLDKSQDNDLDALPEQTTTPGFLTTVVSAVVDKFRNIFGGTPKDIDEDEDEASRCLNLDSSLPNMFEATPSPPSRAEAVEKEEEEFTIPKYPKEYIAMVKKAQRIYKQKAKEAEEAAKAMRADKRPVAQTSGAKRPLRPTKGGLGQKKQQPPTKVYPPGEYSPGYVAEVAKARALAGYKNRSALLNPERAAKMAALKAAKEAEIAAEEALPPVEKMRKRMSRLQRKGKGICPKPSIEILGALEAIRANLPRPKIISHAKPKWAPVARRRADKSLEGGERVFMKSPTRVFEGIQPMTPLTEESYNVEDLIKFTPLRAQERRLRLKYLKERAQLQSAHRTDSPMANYDDTPRTIPVAYSPIKLHSPSQRSPEKFGMTAEAIARDANKVEGLITEEVTKTSTIENGEVHTTTRKVTTKTDELGNVMCHIEEATGLAGEESANIDNIDTIEAPDFLNISDMEPPRDPSVPTPSQIIDKIRKQVQEKLKLIHPHSPPFTESASSQRESIELPTDLPDEQLYDIDMPELDTTIPHHISLASERTPDMSLPFYWDEEKQSPTLQRSAVCPPISAATAEPSHETPTTTCPQIIPKTTEGTFVMPPCPKDPKDYVGMVMYARTLQKYKDQQEAAAAPRTPAPVVAPTKAARVPISRRIVKKPSKTTLPKSKLKKIDSQQEAKLDEDTEIPTEPPPLPTGYAEEVARARELAGYRNRTAALNPKVAAELAAKKAAEEAAKAEFEALSDYQKIVKRMEKLRQMPSQKRRILPSADGIKSAMPSGNEALVAKTASAHQIPVCPITTSEDIQKAHVAPEKQYASEQSPNISLNEFEELERQLEAEAVSAAQQQSAVHKESARDLSLDEFEALERQINAECPIDNIDASLDEFELLERQINAECVTESAQQVSLDEFEKLEKEICQTPSTRTLPEKSHSTAESLVIPQSAAADFYIRKRIRDLQEKLLASGESHTAAGKSVEYSMRKRINDLQSMLNESPVKDVEMPTMPSGYGQSFYQNLMADFCPIGGEQMGKVDRVGFGETELSTPVSPRERFRKIKEQQRQLRPMPVITAGEQSFASPSVAYSPIRLYSPGEESQQVTRKKMEPSVGKCPLVDLETPKIEYNVKQFKDLEDMPFDELEFEEEPAFTNASFDKPLTPPPQPSELIDKIRRQVQERLRSEKVVQHDMLPISPFQFPQQFSEEDLFDLSHPSYAHTTLGDATKDVSARIPSPTQMKTPDQVPNVVESLNVPTPVEPPEEMYKPKYPKGYVEMVMKSRALHKLKQEQEAKIAAAAPPSEPTKKKGRTTIAKPTGRVVVKKGLVRPPKVANKKDLPPLIEAECPTEPPPLPPEYLADVARARQLAGYKNQTAALNPEVAARIAAEEAEAAAFAALPDHEKIKARMERLRKKQGRRPKAQLNMEQLAFIQAMREENAYKSANRDMSPSRALPQQRMSTTPRPMFIADAESPGLAEFEALEQGFISPHTYSQEKPEQQLYKDTLGQIRMKADAQLQQLTTPPQLDARERYKRLLSDIQAAPKTPTPQTPMQTPEVHYSPIPFPASPDTCKQAQRIEKSTTHITKSGENTVKEQVIETSETIDGKVQQVTKLVTTTTDPSGNVTSQVKETTQSRSQETSPPLDELADIEEPSFLDTTPMSPTDIPRPKDIIERIRREFKSKPKPAEVPTGQLIELRTPPRQLPLPEDVIEEKLLELSCPALPKTPTSPMRSPQRSPVRPKDVSLPQVFVATPEPPTPPLPPVSPLRYRVHSPEGPIVIPPCPTDLTDFKAMVRMSRKIYEFNLQKEAEARATAEAEVRAAAIEASKPQKKERVPISRWTAPPPKKPTTRKKLVMRKRAPAETKSIPAATEPVVECPSEPPPLPEGYAEEVARARKLAGLRNQTAALSPTIAAREAAEAAALAEETRKILEYEAAKSQLQNAPTNYNTVMSRIALLKQHGRVPKVQPSLQAAAYLNAVKGAMETAQQAKDAESAETRYKRILAARAHSSPPVAGECSMEATYQPEVVHYTPVLLGSPEAANAEVAGFKMFELEEVGDLEQMQEPSFLDEIGTPTAYTDRHMPTTPITPPPTPSAVIQRIRKEVREKLEREKLHCPIIREAPTILRLPDDMTEEELLELSAPSFAQSPQAQSPAHKCSPNISIPQYFEATPLSNIPTPKPLSSSARKTSPEIVDLETPRSVSPPLLGVHPGLRVLTPEGPLVPPPHPKGPESVVDMIRRAQLIQKIKEKEEASKPVPRTTRPGVRVPLSRRVGGPTARPIRPVGPIKNKVKTVTNEEFQCPAEPPALPADYVAAVARARRLAGLKNTTALLNPPQDYATIMARVAALRTNRGDIEPTAQELLDAEALIRRPEREETTEQQQQTPRPAVERYRAYRSRARSETPTTSRIPYSPVKTPVLEHLPEYTPICLPPTPPFLQNINVSPIEDISMPYDANETGYTDIGDISMPFVMDDIPASHPANESLYCRRGYHQNTPSADLCKRDSFVCLESLQSAEQRHRTDRRR